MFKGAKANSRSYWHIFTLILIASFMLLWRLGNGTLADWDEAIYAQISKETVLSGDWLTLHWGFKPWFDKPPLLMWVTEMFYQLFGVNEFWVRAASAFSGIGLVVITYLIGKLIVDFTTVHFFSAKW